MLSMMILFFLLCSILHGGMCYPYPPVTSYASSTHSAQALQATFTVGNQTYGNGLYTGKVLSLYPYAPENDLFAAFDNDDSTYYTQFWGRYNPFGGEWIQLTLPSPIQLSSFYITTRPDGRDRIATVGVMYGSNDSGNTFDIIQNFIDSNIVVAKTVPMTSSVSYSTFRLLVTKTGGNGWLSIATFQLNGTPSTFAPSTGPTAAPSTVAPSTGPTAAPSYVDPTAGPTTDPSFGNVSE